MKGLPYRVVVTSVPNRRGRAAGGGGGLHRQHHYGHEEPLDPLPRAGVGLPGAQANRSSRFDLLPLAAGCRKVRPHHHHHHRHLLASHMVVTSSFVQEQDRGPEGGSVHLLGHAEPLQQGLGARTGLRSPVEPEHRQQLLPHPPPLALAAAQAPTQTVCMPCVPTGAVVRCARYREEQEPHPERGRGGMHRRGDEEPSLHGPGAGVRARHPMEPGPARYMWLVPFLLRRFKSELKLCVCVCGGACVFPQIREGRRSARRAGSRT